jgi:hypothetical protein
MKVIIHLLVCGNNLQVLHFNFLLLATMASLHLQRAQEMEVHINNLKQILLTSTQVD